MSRRVSRLSLTVGAMLALLIPSAAWADGKGTWNATSNSGTAQASTPGSSSTHQVVSYTGPVSLGSSTGSTSSATAPTLSPLQIFLGNASTAVNTAWCGGMGGPAGILSSAYNVGSCATGTPTAATGGVAAAAPVVRIVNATVLAKKAEKNLTLIQPTIGMSPQAPHWTYVGLPTWLWIQPGQWRTLSATAKAGPTTVTLRATPIRVWWRMGDTQASDGGSTVCPDAGKPWRKTYTDAATTDCSYKYQDVSRFQPHHEFPVTAQLVYQVNWTCRGRCTSHGGNFGEINGPAAHAAERVSEIQTVVTHTSD